MAIQADNIADLILQTQKDLGELKWTMIATNLQKYTRLPQLLKKDSVELQGGVGIQWNIQVRLTGSARMTGLYDTDSISTQDVNIVASVPWRHATANYSIDERAIKMNSGKYQIINLLKQKRISALTDMAELMEQQGWSKPTDSTDTDNAFGIPYWIVKNSSKGFNGGNPAGFPSGCGGVSSATYPNWSNWTDTYSAISKNDLVPALKEAWIKTKFTPPVPHPQYGTQPTVNNYGLYTVYSVIDGLEKLAQDQNDSLGNDLTKYMGDTYLFGRVPVTWVPYLESDTTAPIYGINWGEFKSVWLAGEYMKESPPVKSPTQHRTQVVFIDCTFNFICYNRRSHFVIYK